MQVKCKVIRRLEAGEKASKLAIEYDVSETAIRRWRRDSASLMQMENMGKKTRRGSDLPELDARMYKWFVEERMLGKAITYRELQARAREINKEIGGRADFQASDGWAWRFTRRHGVKMAAGEQLPADKQRPGGVPAEEGRDDQPIGCKGQGPRGSSRPLDRRRSSRAQAATTRHAMPAAEECGA